MPGCAALLMLQLHLLEALSLLCFVTLPSLAKTTCNPVCSFSWSFVFLPCCHAVLLVVKFVGSLKYSESSFPRTWNVSLLVCWAQDFLQQNFIVICRSCRYLIRFMAKSDISFLVVLMQMALILIKISPEQYQYLIEWLTYVYSL